MGATAVLAAGCASIRVHPVEYRLPAAAHVVFPAQPPIDGQRRFARVFCQVLKDADANGSGWGECDQWLNVPSDGQVLSHANAEIPLPSLPASHRVLFVPGFMGKCASSWVRTFGDAAEHLNRLGIESVYLDVDGFAGCEWNAAYLAKEIDRLRSQDSRRFIVVGYSKGACDLFTMLEKHEETRESVAAFVTIAGALGGTRIVDQVPRVWRKLIPKLSPTICGTGDCRALDDMGRDVRHTFIAEHPCPHVPTYSLAAASGTKEKTSRVLRPMWKQLSAHSLDQDGQILVEDAIAPGAVFLGTATADHWAVALPFETVPNRLVQRLVNRNHFPRALLIESILRYVAADLSQGEASAGRAVLCEGAR